MSSSNAPRGNQKPRRMPRPQYQSYGKRGSHHGQSHRGNHISSSHTPLHRMGSGPAPQTAPIETSPPPIVAEEPVPSYSNHEQVVRFVRDAWSKVKKDYTEPPEDPSRHVSYYTEAEPNPRLKDFVPFDLEELSKRRKQIASSHSSTS